MSDFFLFCNFSRPSPRSYRGEVEVSLPCCPPIPSGWPMSSARKVEIHSLHHQQTSSPEMQDAVPPDNPDILISIFCLCWGQGSCILVPGPPRAKHKDFTWYLEEAFYVFRAMTSKSYYLSPSIPVQPLTRCVALGKHCTPCTSVSPSIKWG